LQGNPDMSQQQHPDTETLVAYSESPNDPQHVQIALHLAKCSKCRESVTAVRLVLDNMANLAYSANDGSDKSVIDDEQITQMIAGKLDASTQSNIRELMQQDADLTKRILYHAVNAKLGDDNQNENSSESNVPDLDELVQADTQSISDQLKQWFSSSVSAKVGTPLVAAAAAAFLTFSVFVNTGKETGIQIVAYQDDPTISIYETAPTPGMGFFKNTQATKKPFSGLKMQVLPSGQFLLKWPAVEDAVSYQLSLKQFSQGNVVEVLSQTTNKTSLKTPTALVSSARYEWVLSGETHKGGAFKTFGGFVAK